MTFIPLASPIQDIEQKDILLLNDHPSRRALEIHSKMDTTEGGVLQEALHMAGLTRAEVGMVNIFPTRTDLKGLWHDSDQVARRDFLPEGRQYVGAIHQILAQHDYKVIIPLGDVAAKALLDRADITKIRGYPFQFGERVVIPTLHPREMVWSNYIWRFYLAHDLSKAKRFASGEATIKEPTLVICDSLSLVEQLCRLLEAKRKLTAIDIEVSNYEVSCIGFSFEEHSGWSIPFDQRWSETDETIVWHKVASVLEDPDITKLLQNGIFDAYFLWYKMHILVRGIAHDTMIAHSIVHPDFLKSLGFLAGVHTDLTYWKDQSDFREAFKDEA